MIYIYIDHIDRKLQCFIQIIAGFPVEYFAIFSNRRKDDKIYLK